MKAKVIHSNYTLELETMLNDFIKGKTIESIQYQSQTQFNGIEYTALVLYKE